jgi:Ala-tRNA(Pro) deacylase
MKYNVDKGGAAVEENEKQVYAVLDELAILYERYSHVAVYTVAEAKKVDREIAGKHCKNLFLKDKKREDYYLVILPGEKRADLAALARQAGAGGFTFASEEKLREYLNLGRGSVTPFGLLNDRKKRVRVLVDRDLAGAAEVGFHPNTNTATLIIKFADFARYLTWCGNRVDYVIA